MDRHPSQQINMEVVALIDTPDHLDIIDSFRLLHPKASEYAFFSSAHRTLPKVDHTLGHKQVSINLR